MAFTAKIEYVAELEPTTFQVQDLSVYTAPDNKANITSRSLTILQSDNTALPNYPNPIAWPINGPDFLTFTGLTQDVALQIIMTLVPVTPQSGSTYVAESDVATNRFLQLGLFDIQVAQNNTSPISPQVVKVYRDNSIDLIIEMQNSQTALLYADFTGSQNELNIGTQIIANTQL